MSGNRTPSQQIKRRWKTLERRIAWLESRVSTYSGENPSHDEAELSALKWVMEIAKRELDNEVV
jgi:hypothetical protein